MVTFVVVPVIPTVFSPGMIFGKEPLMSEFLFSAASLYAFIVSQSMLM
jgi:hypothetical protein